MLKQRLKSKKTSPVPCIGKGKITILRCQKRNARASKRFMPGGVEDYAAGMRFDAEERSFNDLHDVKALLDDTAQDRKALLVPGEPIDATVNILRRSRPHGNTPATLRDPVGGVRLFIGDLDGVEPDGFDPAGDPGETLRRFLDRYPMFRGVSFVYQLSNSWGIKPGIRAHLFFILDKPKSLAELKLFAKSLPFTVDSSIYTAGQPIYIAHPIFEDGAIDPVAASFQERIGSVEGEVEELHIPEGQAEAELAHWLGEIEKLGETGADRHPLVNKAAYFLGQFVGAGLLDRDEIERQLLEACETSGAFDEERLRLIEDEIKRAVDDGIKEPREVDDWRAGLKRNENGAIRALLSNYGHVFRHHLAIKGKLAYDVRTQSVIITARVPWDREGLTYPREVTDRDDTLSTEWLTGLGILTSATTTVGAALTAVAAEKPRDGVVEWLEGLPAWDRVGRLESWLVKVVGCPDTVYHRAVGRVFVIGLIARAFQPGCKLDTMMVLVGSQGVLKSTLLRTFVNGPGDWAFTDHLGNINRPQDYIPTLMGPWLIEVPELSAFSKKEVESIKGFLSVMIDRARLAYGRRAVAIPRRCIIAGTTNDSEFLQDVTGNRRFYPVECSKIDLDALRGMREQLFAEALHLYRQGAKWWLEGDEITAALDVQDFHRRVSQVEEQIDEYLSRRGDTFTDETLRDRFDEIGNRVWTDTEEILRHVLGRYGLEGSAHSRRADETDIGRAMTALGWRKTRPLVEGRRLRRYTRRG